MECFVHHSLLNQNSTKGKQAPQNQDTLKKFSIQCTDTMWPYFLLWLSVSHAIEKQIFFGSSRWCSFSFAITLSCSTFLRIFFLLNFSLYINPALAIWAKPFILNHPNAAEELFKALASVFCTLVEGEEYWQIQPQNWEECIAQME